MKKEPGAAGGPRRDKQTKAQPQTEGNNRDLLLPEDQAEAGSPSNYSVSGEEDPGAGLEFLVKRKKPRVPPVSSATDTDDK